MPNIPVYLTKKEPKADLTVLALFADEHVDKNREVPLKAIGDFKNRLGSTHLVYNKDERIMLLGLGDKKLFTTSKWRTAVHSIINSVIALEIESVNLVLPKIPSSQMETFLELTGFALTFSCYRFNNYKRDKNESKLKQVNLVGPISAKLTKAIARGTAIGSAANTSRDLANHPGNVATPTHLAAHALQSAKKFGFNCRVMDKEQIMKENLGLLTGVSLGSEQPPKFIILEYGPRSKPPIVLVGKGLTFDSGGVSIKPADRMEEMKYDMAGGATVLGIFEAIAQLRLPVHIIGLIPSTENLMSGKAVKPGDVLISHDQTSVEIINTDAEGRLVLADAISFAKKYYKPRLIVDYATLTGAVLIALGDEYTGYYTNTDDHLKQFNKSASFTGEKFWQMPLAYEYKDQLRSPIADIKNIGEKGSAGSTTAALFLEHFVGKTPWIHLDIAGTAWTTRSKPYTSVGATAWGVYLTVDFLRNIK
ncbi:MAG: leucyl aminopeptidase [Candidatus Doudnabacteria bacterium]|nr:leucyl aminopeptidase [Candidatus Doudnabacteria bacterium]